MFPWLQRRVVACQELLERYGKARGTWLYPLNEGGLAGACQACDLNPNPGRQQFVQEVTVSNEQEGCAS